MGAKSSIEWTDASWTPIRARNTATGKVGWHCEHASPGCVNCYSETLNRRLGTGLPFKPGHRKDIELFLDEKMLLQPLRWKQPRMIFVCSMTDLFADFVPDERIDRVFAVMALAPQHIFQVLTKRAERMRAYAGGHQTPFSVARAIDGLQVKTDVEQAGNEQIKPLVGWPGYYVSDQGRVFSDRGSAQCIHCGVPVTGTARARYCSQKCRQNAGYRLRTGKPLLYQPTLAEMSPDAGEEGHRRVMLYRDGKTTRHLVHRLVLSTFVRPPEDGEEGCHRDGNPANNALPNLRWGNDPEPWVDSLRHGTHRRYSKLTPEQVALIRTRAADGERATLLAVEFDVSDTQIRNIVTGNQWSVPLPIAWPLPNCWLGVSCEDQKRADERIPHLLATPAAVRFISAEPLLGPIDFTALNVADGIRIDALQPYTARRYAPGHWEHMPSDAPGLDWVIVGGESGPNARPMHPDWARSLRDQCAAAGVAYFHKQNGEFASASEVAGPARHFTFPDGATVRRVGKKAAGRLLDGREHNGMPTGFLGRSAALTEGARDAR